MFDTLVEARKVELAGLSGQIAEVIVASIKSATMFGKEGLVTEGGLYRALLINNFALAGVIIGVLKFL